MPDSMIGNLENASCGHGNRAFSHFEPMHYASGIGYRPLLCGFPIDLVLVKAVFGNDHRTYRVVEATIGSHDSIKAGHRAEFGYKSGESHLAWIRSKRVPPMHGAQSFVLRYMFTPSREFRTL